MVNNNAVLFSEVNHTINNEKQKEEVVEKREGGEVKMGGEELRRVQEEIVGGQEWKTEGSEVMIEEKEKMHRNLDLDVEEGENDKKSCSTYDI